MRIAKVFSYVFHPILMPLLGVSVVLSLELETDFWLKIEDFVYRLMLLCTIILPLTLFISMYILKMINEVSLEEKLETRITLVFMAFCYLLGYFLLGRFLPDTVMIRFPMINLISVFLLACLFLSLALLVVSFFWEMSSHMAAVGGLSGLLMFLALVFLLDLTLYISIVFILSGIIGSILMKLRDQNLAQLFTGWILGFGIVTTTLLVFQVG